MSTPVAKPARFDPAEEDTEMKTLMTRLLEGQRQTNINMEAMAARQAEVERRLEELAQRPMAAGAGPSQVGAGPKIKIENDDAETHEGSADTVRVGTPWFTAHKGAVRDFRIPGSSANAGAYPTQEIPYGPQVPAKLDSTIPSHLSEPPYHRAYGPHPENLFRDLDYAGVLHQADAPAPAPPIKYQNYNAASKGLTAIVVGEQEPFKYRLKIFDVKHVYNFLRHVEEYHQAYEVQVQMVSFIDQNILDAIKATRDHGRDLPPHMSTWSPSQLRIAMCRYFTTFHYTPRDLCAVAQEVVLFPKVHLAGVVNQERKAIAQLCQVPIYAAGLTRFQIFVETYQLLSKGWPDEKNPTWKEPRRLNEVFIKTLQANAPEAYTMLSDDLHKLRKSNINALLYAMPDCVTNRIASLNYAAEVSDLLREQRQTPVPDRRDDSRVAGKGREWLKSSPTSDAVMAANFAPRNGFPHRKLNAMQSENGSDSEENQDTWSDAQPDPATVLEATPPGELEELHNIQEAERRMVDRSKEACHTFFFSSNGCTFVKQGKTCPYSHDTTVGQRAVEAAIANLKKLSLK